MKKVLSAKISFFLSWYFHPVKAKISRFGFAPSVDHSYKALMAQVVYKEKGTLEQVALTMLPLKVRIELVLLP